MVPFGSNMKYLILIFLFLISGCAGSHSSTSLEENQTDIIDSEYQNKIYMPTAPVTCPANVKGVDDKIKECIVENVDHIWIKAI
tara:strand:+ start:267 stop:518 length:252 start_codon:yes stop_codon:yes gene_type:complete